jgi:capsular exopolysaccharide synthesis family protein
LDEQLTINTDSLELFENRILDFQDENNTVSLSAETSSLYAEIQSLEAQRSQILINDRYYDYLLKTLRDGSEFDKITIPASIGVDDPVLAELVSRLISSQMEVKNLLEDNKTKNPLVANKQKEINELKTHILSTVENLRGAKQITLDELNSRLGQSRVALSKMPKAQQELGGIERNYGINENLYMLLMNKKLETGIQLAATLSDYKKINDAYVIGGPVSPDYNKNYLFGVFGGLALPIALLYLSFFINDRITSKEEIHEVLSQNIVATIPEEKRKIDASTMVELDSPIGESFRTMRTNLGYIRKDIHKGQVLMITSSISGEGKTFISQHLAYVMAMAHKKVILINCDMRKPYGKDKDEQKGLSEYLAGMATYKEIEMDTYMPSLKMINAGLLPPNPAELLLNYRMESLLLDLKQDGYDYIILDSAPIGIFSDALGLVPQIDQMLIVARHNFTPKPAMKHLREVLEGTPKDKMSIIYNGVFSTRRMDAYNRYYHNYNKSLKQQKKKRSVFGRSKSSSRSKSIKP